MTRALGSFLTISARVRRKPLGGLIAPAGRWMTRSSPRILHGRLVHLFERRASELLAAESPPGCAVCVATPARASSFVRGLANAESGLAMTPDLPFRAASLAKPMVALAALTLVRDGLLSLDERVALQIGGRDIPRDGAFGDPTLRQLLSHTAGLNVHSLPQNLAGEAAPDWQDLLLGGGAYQLRQVSAPGSQVLYSGAGLVLAGMVVERAAGRPIQDVVRERVFDPLGMTCTTMAPEAQATEPMCREHGPERNVLPKRVAHAVASGSLTSTPRDFQRFASAMLGRKGGPFAGLLGDCARELLRPCGPSLANPIYSVGFRIRLRGGMADLSHGGIREGTRAVLESIGGGAAAVFALANGEAGFRVIGPMLGEAKAMAVRAGLRGGFRPLPHVVSDG